MAIPLIINGVTFQYPQQFDKNWGPTLTNWSSAVTTGMLQKAGGAFTLTAEVDFGGSFGMKVLSVKSQESNIATTGVIRLANASTGVVWRNALHNADLALTVNSSNQLTFNGISIGATTSLTDGHILVGNVSNQPADVAMTGDITITNAGVTSVGAGKIVDSQVNASAAIAWSKLATGTPYRWLTLDSGGVIVGTGVTASKAIISDSNGLPSASSVTATELGYVAGVTSAIQTQINALNSVPAGAMLDFAGTAAPTGWLLCDGTSYLRATYPALFTAIGTTWGSADGTHFNVPNMTRRVGVGSGGSGSATLGNAVGNTGGEETHTLITGEMPTHSHTVTDPGHVHDVHSHDNDGSGTTRYASGLSSAADSGVQGKTYSQVTGVSLANTGGGGAHNNIQPSAVVLKIIKT